MLQINIRRRIASNFIVPSTKFGGRGKQKIKTRAHIDQKKKLPLTNKKTNYLSLYLAQSSRIHVKIFSKIGYNHCLCRRAKKN